MYAAVKFIFTEYKRFNIHQKGIGLYGISGGAFIVSGVTYHMAINNDSYMIKTIFLDVP